MKKKVRQIIEWAVEMLVLIAPTTGYAIYCYEDTLQYTLTETSKGSFWTLISLALLLGVVFSIFKSKWEVYKGTYVTQLADWEVHPEDENLAKVVESKRLVVENITYLVAVIPILILAIVVYAFQSAVDQLQTILWILAGSVIGKIALHSVSIHIEKIKGLQTETESND